MKWKKVALAVLLAEALVFVAMGTAYALDRMQGPNPHDPIVIEGDAAFTEENGVRSGSGTADDPYVIEGWKIDQRAQGIRIAETSSHFIIRDCVLLVWLRSSGWTVESLESYGYQFAPIHLHNVSNGIISDCQIVGEGFGIALFGCEDIKVVNNSVAELGSQTQMVSLAVVNSRSITVSGNDLGSGGIYVTGSVAADYTSLSISDNNLVNSKPVLFLKDRTSARVSGEAVGQIILVNCTDAMLREISVDGAGPGMVMAFVKNSTIADCKVSRSSHYGILLSCCSNVTLWRVEASECYRTGIGIRDSSMISLHDCRLLMNDLYGLDLDGSSSSNVTNSLFTGAGTGISITDGTNDSVSGCEISTPLRLGLGLGRSTGTKIDGNRISGVSSALYIGDNATNVSMHGNLVAGNDIGVTLRANSSGARIYLNNFINNKIQVKTFDPHERAINGTYAEGGNYWSNYSGEDVYQGVDQSDPGSDGIADEPFEVVSKVMDSYPRVAPLDGYRDRPVSVIGLERPYLSRGRGVFVDADMSWDFSDAGNMTYRWTLESWDSEYSNVSDEYVTSSTSGALVLRLQVKDKEGNVTEVHAGLLNDNDAPSVTLWRNPSDYYDSGEYDLGISYHCNDLGAGFQDYYGTQQNQWYWNHIDMVNVYIDNVLVGDAGIDYSAFASEGQRTHDGSYSFPRWPLGFHTVKVTAQDIVGNVNETEIAVGGPLGASPPTFAGMVAVFAGALVVAIAYLVERDMNRAKERRDALLRREASMERTGPPDGPDGEKVSPDTPKQGGN